MAEMKLEVAGKVMADPKVVLTKAGVDLSPARTGNPVTIPTESWHSMHEQGWTPWHDKEKNPILQHIKDDHKKGRVLVTLCGEDVSMIGIAKYPNVTEVVGVDFSPEACKNFFENNKISYKESEHVSTSDNSKYKLYEGQGYGEGKEHFAKIKLYVMDFYKFPDLKLDQFDMCYDRASFVAINLHDREKYAKLIQVITN